MRPMLEREMDVGDTDLGEIAAARCEGRGQRPVEVVVALDRKGGEQAAFVGEVMGRRRVGHPRPAREIAQADRCGTDLEYRVGECVKERATEIAMVVRGSSH